MVFSIILNSDSARTLYARSPVAFGLNTCGLPRYELFGRVKLFIVKNQPASQNDFAPQLV